MEQNTIMASMAETAKAKFEHATSLYLMIFCIKHEFDIKDGYWIGDQVGGIFTIGDYFFNFSDIKLDIDLNAPDDAIIEWSDYSLKERMKNESPINYYSYLKTEQ